MLPRLAALGQNLDRLGVAATDEGFLEHEVEAGEKFLVHELAEELEVGGAMFLRIANQVFHERFGEVHVASEIAERNLGLDHPKFGGVAGGVRVLGAKGRSEGVDV